MMIFIFFFHRQPTERKLHSLLQKKSFVFSMHFAHLCHAKILHSVLVKYCRPLLSIRVLFLPRFYSIFIKSLNFSSMLFVTNDIVMILETSTLIPNKILIIYQTQIVWVSVYCIYPITPHITQARAISENRYRFKG